MKKIFIIFIIAITIAIISIFSVSLGNDQPEESSSNYSNSTEKIGTVTTETLKIRSGLGTNYDCIGLLKHRDTIHIYDKIDNWYIIKTDNNLVGCVSADYITCSYADKETTETSNNIKETENTSSTILSQDEQIFFNLINNERIQNNLPEFKIDEEILNIARLKANDIVEKNYFSHTSPTYGSIFDMLKSNNITYTKASENIARNTNASSAIDNLMKSESHKNNILSSDFEYTGIAVTNSINYGKIFVEIFISK